MNASRNLLAMPPAAISAELVNHFRPWFLVLAALLASSIAQPARAQTSENHELRNEVWLIKHGVHTSQWRSRACRTLALALADEDKMTTERLALARTLAENAGTAHRCNRDSTHPRAILTP